MGRDRRARRRRPPTAGQGGGRPRPAGGVDGDPAAPSGPGAAPGGRRAGRDDDAIPGPLRRPARPGPRLDRDEPPAGPRCDHRRERAVPRTVDPAAGDAPGAPVRRAHPGGDGIGARPRRRRTHPSPRARCARGVVPTVTQDSQRRPSNVEDVIRALPRTDLRTRVGQTMNNRIGLAHLGGIVLATVSGMLTNAHRHRPGFGHVDVLAFALYVPLSMTVCGLRSHHIYQRATTWLAEDREPTDAEQRSVLALPWREATEGLLPWLVAAAIWGCLNGLYYGNGVTYTLRTALSICLGGLASCAIAYLLAERTLRPVFALALARGVPDRAGSLGVRAKLLLSWVLGCDVFLLSIGLTYLGRPGDQPPSAAAIWFLVDSGLAAGFIVLYVAARSLADPLQQLRKAVHDVQRGELDRK